MRAGCRFGLPFIQAELDAARTQLKRARRAKAVEVACGEAEHMRRDALAREPEHRRREEHALVVRVRDHEQRARSSAVGSERSVGEHELGRGAEEVRHAPRGRLRLPVRHHPGSKGSGAPRALAKLRQPTRRRRCQVSAGACGEPDHRLVLRARRYALRGRADVRHLKQCPAARSHSGGR